VTEDAEGIVRVKPDGQASEYYALSFDSWDADGTAVFAARVPPSSVDFSYRAYLRDGRTRGASSVRFVPRPTVDRLEAWVVLPEYCGLRPDGTRYEEYQSKGDVLGLPGSSARVAVEVQENKSIVEATLEVLGQPHPEGREEVMRRVPMRVREDARGAEGTFELRRGETAYRVVVEDEHGFTNAHPPRRGLAVAAPEPPQVLLLPERFPGNGEAVLTEDTEVEGMPVPLGKTIRVAYFCRSAVPLDKAWLRYRVNDGEWQPLPLAEVKGTEEAGPFDFRRGAFENSGLADQVEFHAAASPDLERVPPRREGGGRFEFQTRKLPELKVGDQVEFYVEVFDRSPEGAGRPGRSEARVKTVITDAQFVDWVLQNLQQESRVRQLEEKQRGIFGRAPAP
jgi:hypothetical protein